MNSPYERNDKNQTKVPTSAHTDKNIDSNLEALAKLRRDYPSNPIIGYFNINSIRNKIVQLTDTCKTTLIEILCIDETNLDQVSQMRKFIFLITSSHLSGETEIHLEEEK